MSDPNQPPAQPPVDPAVPPAQPPAAPATPPPAAPAAPATPPPAAPAAPATPPPPAPAAPAAPPAAAPAAPAPAAPAAAAPAAPAAAVPPPAYPAPGAPTAAAPTPGGNFKSNKNKTIAMIAGGVVAVGLLGGIAAAVLGGGDDDGGVTEAGSSSNSGVLSPSPVGNAGTSPSPSPSPAPPSPTSTPDSGSTPSPSPEPSPAPAPPPPPSGDGITLANGITIALPSGWEVQGSGDSDALITDGQGSYMYALTGTADPSQDALALLQGNLDKVLPDSAYSGLTFAEPTAEKPFGSVTSFVTTHYDGMWVDSQSSTPFHGLLLSAIRADGTALILAAEHAPPDGYNDAINAGLGQAVDDTINPFGSN